MNKLILVLVLLLVSGCAYLQVGKEKTAEVADEELKVATWMSCQTPTLGALMRRFSNLDDLVTYVEHCVWLRE